MKDVETYSNIALGQIFSQNPNQAKTSNCLLHRRKGLNREIHLENLRKKKQGKTAKKELKKK